MDKNIQLPIIDLFVSLQGEGKFVGHPSLFIRVSGCNLRCCFKDSICDTSYSSFRPETSKFNQDDVIDILRRYPKVDHIVITGGEPMLYQDAIIELLNYLRLNFSTYYYVTIETNGSIRAKSQLMDKVTLFSISPKLSTSVPEVGKEYSMPDGSKVKFAQEEVNRFNRTRYNEEAIVSMSCPESHLSSVQLKFVYSGRECIAEIESFVENCIKKGAIIYTNNIMLMPEGINTEQINKNGREAAEICIEKGWTFSDRLHIRLWGDRRGY